MEGIGFLIGGAITYGTGEVLLWAFTLGKHKPGIHLLDADNRGFDIADSVFREVSFYLGLAFWITIFAIYVNVA